jgi:DNA-binding transcriptional regulator LsrR (DeoR family)
VGRKAGRVDYRLLTKVSKLYYEQNLTQQQIAERLHLSRPKVSRLLQQAQDWGVVQITVLSPQGSHTDLEQQLESRFQLKEAVVIDVGSSATREAVARELGAAAARYLQRTIADSDVIGLSWGTTLNAMVNALSPFDVRDVLIVQIIGGLGAPEAEVHATDICRRFARLLSARLTLIPAPGIVDSARTRDALMSDSHIQTAFHLFSRITMAFVGIGVPLPTSVVMRDGAIMTPAQLDELLALGAVGDIGLRFFDAEGHPIRSALDDLVIGITLEQLRHIQCVVGVAGGQEKLQAVFGALVGGLINVLITDEALAQTLLAQPAMLSNSLEDNGL